MPRMHDGRQPVCMQHGDILKIDGLRRKENPAVRGRCGRGGTVPSWGAPMMGFSRDTCNLVSQRHSSGKVRLFGQLMRTIFSV